MVTPAHAKQRQLRGLAEVSFPPACPSELQGKISLCLQGRKVFLHDLKDPPSNYQVRLIFLREAKTVTKRFFALEILLDLYRLLLGQIISGGSKNKVKNLEMDSNFFPFVP